LRDVGILAGAFVPGPTQTATAFSRRTSSTQFYGKPKPNFFLSREEAFQPQVPHPSRVLCERAFPELVEGGGVLTFRTIATQPSAGSWPSSLSLTTAPFPSQSPDEFFSAATASSSSSRRIGTSGMFNRISRVFARQSSSAVATS